MARTFRWVVVLLGAALVVAIVARQLRKPDRHMPHMPHVPPVPYVPPRPPDGDRLVDEEIDESFPASDAPSHWAGGAD